MSEKLKAGKFYGRTLQKRELGGLMLAETAYPAGLEIPSHEHANPFFCLILEGCSTQTCAGRSWTISASTLMVFPSGLAHANRWHDSGGRVLHVEFTPSWLERLSGRSAVLDRPANYEEGPPVWLARRLFQEHRRNDAVTPLAAEGLALELLAECSRVPTRSGTMRRPAWLDRVEDFLHEYVTRSLSLDEIATVAGVSPDHLARSFRRYHGCTIGEFVRRQRVERACRQLAMSDASLVEIALEAGFADQSHLTKVFRRHMRTTPAAFKRVHRGRMSRTKS
jgi:AraC family transcriptional regulator